MEKLDPRLHAFRPDLAAESLRDRVSADRFTAGGRKQVHGGSLLLRAAPRMESGIISEILFGEIVRVYEDKDGWAWLQNETDSYVGYAQSAGLSETIHPATHVVAVLRTYLYTDADLKSPTVELLSMSAEVSVAETDGAYARLAGGGWVWAAHLAALDAFETDHAAVALRFLGTPYLWGGRTSLGLDCSGLVQVALARCGKKIPRDSDMQEAVSGAPVPFDGDFSVLRHGDHVIWPGHCGFCLGEARFVHANATDMMVSIGTLADIARQIERAQGDPIRSVRRP